jgi:hypothetical protein
MPQVEAPWPAEAPVQPPLQQQPCPAQHVQPAAMDVGDPIPAALGAALEAGPAGLVEPTGAAAATDALPLPLPTEPAGTAVDGSGGWWSTGNALVLAVAAISWQFVAYYASVQLPAVVASGQELTYFDQVVGKLPLASSSLGVLPGIALGMAALALLGIGRRRGLRDTGMQVLVGALALVGILLSQLLPILVG